jgi:hypothetical protein
MLLRGVLWVSLSLVLHAAVFAVVVLRAPELPASVAETELWMEAAPPAIAEPPPPPAPPPDATPPSPAPSRSSRAPRAPKAVTPPVAAAPELTAPVVDGPSSVAVTAGDGANAIGSTGGSSDGTGRGQASAGSGAREAERKAGPAQLSLWVEPARLEGLALARPTIALLMAMPGYADILRGSGIRPLLDLQRLRLRLSGLQAERLIVAGVHHSGNEALVAAAERVAAMRDQAPVWRGDDDFRATSWVDGTATDRGLAVHGGAFVIAPRQAMPELLGRGATEESVQAVSRLRDRVLALITIEDAPRYLPRLDACELQALRISVADAGGSPRMTLAAHYKTASLANDAPACLQKLHPELGAQMPTLLAWLARAQVSEGSGSSQLSTGVNSNDIEKLFNELAWALRSARRA